MSREHRAAAAEASQECRIGASASLEQEAFLAVLKTADVLQNELAALLKPAELSPTQYNVLRILRGAGEEGLPCGRITERMLTHDPDMTRLLDRLEKRGLIERFRDDGDRRIVRAQILSPGRKLLAEFDEAVLRLHREQFTRLGPRELKALGDLLARARERADEAS